MFLPLNLADNSTSFTINTKYNNGRCKDYYSGGGTYPRTSVIEIYALSCSVSVRPAD